MQSPKLRNKPSVIIWLHKFWQIDIRKANNSAQALISFAQTFLNVKVCGWLLFLET